MAKNIYVGVGSKARKVKALYVGVGGKARKVKKVYVGVGGKAHLAYEAYIPVTSISFSIKDTNSMEADVTATIVPANATNKTITWTFSGTNPAWSDTSDPNTKHIKASGRSSTVHSYSKAVITAADGITYTIQAIREPASRDDKAYLNYRFV